MTPDSLLTAAQLAEVLGQTKRWVLRNAQGGRKALLPCIRCGHRTVKFHLLTVRLALARASGLKVTAADLISPTPEASAPSMLPAASPASGPASGDPLSQAGGVR